MRKNTKKAVCIFFAVLLLVCSFPISVFAVDPVSASVIANSFAQAITAYGAANGVSLGFDVTNTDSIGESVHELWAAFRSGTQTTDDYLTLANALFPDLYYKAEKAIVGAQTASYVGMRITAEYAEEFDNFYNWLLSGPAEMVQVDNQYYEWSSAQTGSSAVFLPVYSDYAGGFFQVPVVSSSASRYDQYQSAFPIFMTDNASGVREQRVCALSTSGGTVYFFLQQYVSSNVTYYKPVFFSASTPVNGANVSRDTRYPANNSYYYTGTNSGSTNLDAVNNIYYSTGTAFASGAITSFFPVPVYSSLDAGFSAFLGNENPEILNNLGVKAYGNATTADFPDTADPNYDALHRAKDIPLDTPWDDTVYGDGTGTLTEAQSGAITETIDDILIAAGEIDITQEGTDDPTPPDPDDDPSDDPGDYGVLGLENIFPFCIPFDIYNFLDALAANPTAPHFTATLQLPAALGGAQTIDLDFDNPTFNQLAQLLRLLELLAFIVGLALLTRSMFIRG